MGIVFVRDCIGSNLSAVAAGWKGQFAGYVTGSGGVPWTPAQLEAHPGTVLIDQTPTSGWWDPFADVDDVENGAVQLSEIAGRAKERKAAFAAAKRPGQREPAVYASEGQITPVVNALISGGVTSGVHLWIANWSVSEASAAQAVIDAAGPFPICGWQFADAGIDDLSVFSSTWLSVVSMKQPPPTPHPPGPPFRHTTQPGDQVAAIAASRNVTPRHLLQLAAASYTAEDIDILAGHHLPGGVPWYSSVWP
jgi:hypothetical protein